MDRPRAVNVGVANLPNQKHRVAAKRGVTFTLMNVGPSGTGKTTFVNTLFSRAFVLPRNYTTRYVQDKSGVRVTEAELEERKFTLRLAVVDTPGFGDALNNNASLAPILAYIEEQYSSYLSREMRADRSGTVDTRVHAVLYFIEPTGHSLTALDIQAMKGIGRLTNLIPVIAKADTLTPEEMAAFKKRIRLDLSKHGIEVYTSPIDSDDEDTAKLNRDIADAMPYAIIGSEDTVVVNGQAVLGRQYRWGVALVENDAHCDFKKLRSLLLRTHLEDLIVTMHERHYEAFRESRLRQGGLSDDVTPEQLRREYEETIKRKEDEIRKRSAEELRIQTANFQNREAQIASFEKSCKQDVERLQAEVKQLQETLRERMAAAASPKKK